MPQLDRAEPAPEAQYHYCIVRKDAATWPAQLGQVVVQIHPAEPFIDGRGIQYNSHTDAALSRSAASRIAARKSAGSAAALT